MQKISPPPSFDPRLMDIGLSAGRTVNVDGVAGSEWGDRQVSLKARHSQGRSMSTFSQLPVLAENFCKLVYFLCYTRCFIAFFDER